MEKILMKKMLQIPQAVTGRYRARILQHLYAQEIPVIQAGFMQDSG